MMDANPNDDSRKKRDSTDVVKGDTPKSEEKTKKLRAAKQRPLVPCKDFTFVDRPSVPARSSLALEDALQLLVRMGNDSNIREYLSDTKWVNFRLGHAADASQIASCYRKRKQKLRETNAQPKNEADLAIPLAEDSSLEITLADGLGSGDAPPSFFALLADIVTENADSSPELGAVALLSSGWEDSYKTLRVEFFYVIDDDNFSDVFGLLERRMWLRLSSLAIMTSNQLIIAEKLAKKPAKVA